jgi:putative aldouronate transport system substrate-binding protein
MKQTKWLSLLLSTGLLLAATACGSSNNTNSNGENASTAAPASAEATAAPGTSENAAKPELKSLNLWSKDDYHFR